MGENDAEVYYPDIRQSVWLLIRVVLWVILLSIPLGVVDYFVDYPLYKHPASLAIINLAAFGLVLKWGIGKAGRTLEEVCPTSSTAASLYPAMALLCMGANILLSETDNIFENGAASAGMGHGVPCGIGGRKTKPMGICSHTCYSGADHGRVSIPRLHSGWISTKILSREIYFGFGTALCRVSLKSLAIRRCLHAWNTLRVVES